MSAVQKDLYRTLELNENAELAVIKAAYKALMMIYHPDRYRGDKKVSIKKSKEINEAYAVLVDPDKRKKYDAERPKNPTAANAIPERDPQVRSEFNNILKESEAILDILDISEIVQKKNAYYKALLMESEAILTILNAPD